MNTPEILNHLDKVFTELLMNVMNQEQKDLLKKNAYFAGGCFKSLMLNEPVNDYDIYFKNDKSAKQWLKTIKDSKNSMFATFDVDNLKILAETDNAVTFEMNGKNLQFITKFTGAPSDVIQKFDFIHTWNYYVPLSQTLSQNKNPKQSNTPWSLIENDNYIINETIIKEKKLVYNVNAPFPVRALKRMVKFLKTGMTIEDDELIEIAKAIKNHDLNDEKVLVVQATGMYLDKETKQHIVKEIKKYDSVNQSKAQKTSSWITKLLPF